MTKLIALTALSIFLAMSAAAFAQSYDPSVGSGNIVPGPKGGMQSGMSSPQPLYNYAPLSGGHRHGTRLRAGER